MKIKPEDFEVLKTAIHQTMITLPLDIYRQYKDKGLSDKRFRWDLLNASQLKIGDGKGVSGLPLYGYLNDDHIDTALKVITNTK